MRSANPNYPDIEWTPQHKIGGILVAVLKEDLPGLREYQDMIISKESRDEEWHTAITEAVSSGLSPQEFVAWIEMMKKFAQKK